MYLIVNELTRDRATAEDAGGAELARRILRNEGVDHGADPTYRPLIVLVPDEEGELR